MTDDPEELPSNSAAQVLIAGNCTFISGVDDNRLPTISIRRQGVSPLTLTPGKLPPTLILSLMSPPMARLIKMRDLAMVAERILPVAHAAVAVLVRRSPRIGFARCRCASPTRRLFMRLAPPLALRAPAAAPVEARGRTAERTAATAEA